MENAVNAEFILEAIGRARSDEARATLVAAYQAESLRESMLSCTRCSLHQRSKQPVPWQGGRSTVVLVGEAPGKTEDELGVPFVGRAGRLLDEQLSTVGMPRSTVSVMNVIACRPVANDFSVAVSARAPELCSEWFTRQLDTIGAWLGVLLGGQALRTILGDRKAKISQWRGRPFWRGGRLWMPTWHPAYLLRSPSAIPEFQQDLSSALRLLEHDAAPPLDNPGFLAAWSDRSILGDRVLLRDALHLHGWALVASSILWDRVVVCTDTCDRKVRAGAFRLPATVADLPRWSLSELATVKHLVDRGEFGVDDLRRCNRVKQHLGGRIIL